MGVNLEKAHLDSPELRQQLLEGHDRIKQMSAIASKFSTIISKIATHIEDIGSEFSQFSYELTDLLNFERDNFFTSEEKTNTPTLSTKKVVPHRLSKHTSGTSQVEILFGTVSKLNLCIKTIQEQKAIVDKIKLEVISPLTQFNIQVEQLDYVKTQVDTNRSNYEVQLEKYCSLSRKKEERKMIQKDHLTKLSNVQNDFFCSLISYMSKINMMNRKEGLFLISKTNLFLNQMFQWATQTSSYVNASCASFNETFERCQLIDQERPTEDLELFMNLNIAKLPKYDQEDMKDEHLILNERGYKSGYLRYRPRGKKEWKRKYFYVQKPEGLLMSIENNDSPIMVADIKSSMVQLADIDDRYNTFQIICPPHSLIPLQAENGQDLNDWMRTFRAIQLSDTGLDRQELLVAPISAEWSAEIDDLMAQPFTPISANSINTSTPRTPTLTRVDDFGVNLNNMNFLKEAELVTMNVGCCEMKSQKWKGKIATIVASGYMKLASPPNERKEEPITIFKISDIPMEFIIPVHPTLFDRKHVFCIKYQTKIFYLKCDDAEKYNKLTYWLKHFSIKPGPALIGNELIPVRYLRNIFLKLLDGRNFPNRSQFYFTVSIDNILIGRTPLIDNTPDLMIREDFKFEDLPSLNFGITISAYDTNATRFTKDQRFGRVFVRVNKLKNGKEEEEYYQLVPGDEKDEETKPGNVGEVRIKWKYQEITVLPIHKYQPLLSRMNDFNYDLLKSLYKSAFDLEPLSHNLLMIYIAQNKEVEWLMFLIDHETQHIGILLSFRCKYTI